MLGLRMSPELIIFFPFALMLDAIGIILICFGLDDVGVTDFIGTIFLGSWIWFREGTRIRMSSKKLKKKSFRFFGSAILESIPYLGALPFWTIMSYLTLKDANVPEEEEGEEEPQGKEDSKKENKEPKKK